MKARVLIIGASGRVGSYVVKELERNNEGIEIRYSTSREETAEKWRTEGRDAVVLDLNKPEGFAKALEGVDRVFLLTGYTSDMLYQSKKLVDAAVDAGVKHIVHLGVYGTGNDLIPHYAWHDLIETYIKASGIAWTNIHPNVITDSILVTNPPITETGSFSVSWGDTPHGYVFAEDIGAVSAAVLREGPQKHAGKDYWLSIEVLTSSEVADIISEAVGKEIKCDIHGPEALESYISYITDPGTRAYMESALISTKLAIAGKSECYSAVCDDVLTVLGRPGTTIADWARKYFNQNA